MKCRVCVALTVLGWPDLSRVPVCCGCSGPLTVGGEGVGLWMLGFGECQGACGGIYSFGFVWVG